MSIETPQWLYTVDDKPPLRVALLLACQHMIPVISLSLFAVMVLRQTGAPLEQIKNVTSMSLIAAAVGVFLQSLKKGPVGSGYLAAQTNSAVYIGPSLAAGAVGGPALIWGMTLVAGLFEALLSRLISRVRTLFPPRVCGVVVTMVGLALVEVALRKFMGLDAHDHITDLEEVAVAVLTLATLMGLSIWGRGWLRLNSLLLSLGLGYAASVILGLVDASAYRTLGAEPWFDMPDLMHNGLSFDWALLPPFLVAALAASVKASGLIITSQQINHPEQKEADMANVGRGVLADALGTVTCGLLGTIGTNVSPTSVGLTEATGAASRHVGRVTALLLVIASFLPKVIAFIALLPQPVIGAVLVYTVCVITASGLRLLMTADQGPRLTYLVGISLLAGLSVEVVPSMYDQLPEWGRLALKSPITVAAVTAMILNLLFNMGEKKQS